jgi:hypothetical protein
MRQPQPKATTVLTIFKVEEMGKYVVFVEAELSQSAADDALPIVRLFGSGCGEKSDPFNLLN